MKIFEPLIINDANLLFNGFDGDYPTFDPLVSYGLGDFVEYHRPNTVVTIDANTSPPINYIYWADHQLLEQQPVMLTTTGYLPDGTGGFLSVEIGKVYPNRAYYIDQISADGNYFSLSDRPGGSPKAIYGAQSGTHTLIVLSHYVYKSKHADNLGNHPRKNPDDWLNIGATNQFKCFDGSVTSQTRDWFITKSIKINKPANCLTLHNLSGAAQVDVIMTDAVEGEIYNRSFNLVSTAGIGDFYDWFFQPITRKSTLTITDIPPCADAILDIFITTGPSESTSKCACGAINVGMAIDAGDIESGASLGITDFSVKDLDQFGNYTIVERAYNKRANFLIPMKRSEVDRFFDMLTYLRAKPAVYIGTTINGSTTIFGFAKTWSIVLEDTKNALLSLEVEGLT